eukprot:symbB.v1.2.033007.t1/scaffold4040.1/size45707/4
MTRPGVGPLPAPPSWLPAPAPAATLKARAVSVPRHVVQGSRVVPPPVSRYPPGVVLQAYSPGARVQIAVVQRQVSSPNLSPKPTSFVVPAPSPGLVVQRPRPLCAPLPTWAAPATPPRAGHVVDEKDSDFAPSVPSSGVPSAPNEESAESRAGCDTLCEKLEATRKELTQMSQVREANFRLSTVSMVDASKRDLHDFGDRMNQIDVIEESETTGQTSGIPSPDSQTFKPTTKTVATDTDDLATWTGDVPTLTEPVTAAVDVDVENLEGKGEEVKEVKEVTSEVTQGDQVEDVECHGTQAEGVEGQTQRKKCEIPEIPEGPGSARQPGPKIRTALEGSQSRSTSVRVQITNRSNPRLRPNSRPPKESKDSKESKESKEQKERSASRPRMATQLHDPVSARLSSRRPKVEVSGLEKSFSARELSRPQPRQKGVLEIADVARLVASPEIGTLDDFLPNPAPEPEVLENARPEAGCLCCTL